MPANQNLIILQTKCTNCRCSFNITQEQLQAHQGLVRCGKCQEVFQAKEHIRVLSDQEIAIEKMRYQQQLEQRRAQEKIEQQEKIRQQNLQKIKIQNQLASESAKRSSGSPSIDNLDQATKQKIALAQMQMMMDQSSNSDRSKKSSAMRWVMAIFILTLVVSAMMAPSLLKSMTAKKTKPPEAQTKDPKYNPSATIMQNPTSQAAGETAKDPAANGNAGNTQEYPNNSLNTPQENPSTAPNQR